MIPIIGRTLAICVTVGAVGLLLVAPWKAPQTLVSADGEPIVDDGSFEPVPGFPQSTPHELISYPMPEPSVVPPLPDGVEMLTWADLWADGALSVPEGERIGTPTEAEFPEGTTFEDMRLFFMDLADMRSLQPKEGSVRPDLDGRRVRLAGYTTPVGFAEDETSFLLVPVLGACIHVPPPPPNQIVYVKEAAGSPEMFEPVWITGTLRVDPKPTILADVGYRMEDVIAAPFR